MLAALATASHLGAHQLDAKRLSLGEGLSQSTVYCILEDHFGFLWVGGENGLNRYDGYGFRHFTHDPDDSESLSSNQVRALLQDRDGLIWVGTVDAGISIFDYATHEFHRVAHDPGDPGTLGSNDVRDVVQDAEGSIWVATAAGIDRLSPGVARWRHYAIPSAPGKPTDTVGAFVLAIAPDQTLWAGSELGLHVLSRTADSFVRQPTADGGIDCPVVDLTTDGNDFLWIASGTDGVIRLDRATRKLTRLRHSPGNDASVASDYIESLCLDHSGLLWIGTADRGLDRLDPSSGALDHFSFTTDEPGAVRVGGVTALLEGRSQILWIGTGFAGLNKVDLKERQFETVAGRSGDTTLDGQVVFAILEGRDGLLWIGTQDALLRVERATGRLEEFHPDPGRPDRAVYALHQNEDGTLWVGTWAAGLVHLDPHSGRTVVYRHDPEDETSLAHDRVLVITPAGDGRLWIGTWGGGLDLFDPATGRFLHHRVADGTGLASDRIHALRVASSGRLWVGTTGGGVSRLDPGEKTFATYLNDPDDPTSLSSNDVAFISEARDGALWIATAGGLNRLDPATGHCESYREKHGLPSDATTAALWGEDGLLWVAHFHGLSRFNPTSRKFENFDTSDGLASAEFNASACFAAPSGELFFGGVGGVTAFFPGHVSRNPYPPTAVITACTVYGEELPIGGAVAVADTIRLRHDQDFLGFEFTGLELTFPERNRYAHKLESFDRSWVDAGSRRYASYTNVPPGTYTFLVKAANNHGVWGDPARLTIFIAPPFWQTWWFRAAAVGSAALLLAAVFGWRTRSLRTRLAAQEILVAQRTRQLADANAELRSLAARDSLTGVPNRRRFTEFIDAEWRRAARFGRPLAAVMIDVDDFKAYNDSYGHQAGDHCLRAIAERLAEIVGRPGDLLARYGGEEFVVALSETEHEQAEAVAERMRRAVEDLAIRHPRSRAGVVTVSLGVASVEASGAATWEALLGLADQALYAAKSAGKNRVVAAGNTTAGP